MSWQVASFAVLGIVLLAGFAWYERSKPPSQVVAVVAALAALAVAGRIAFAAIPNVVATTDIVLFAGFVFGAAPGFAVGALGGLVSNFWLGQGPWTPWQMAAWGLCGIAGALLGRATGREIGRIWLATACAVAGVAFGAIMNFSLMVTYGGEVTLERFLALESRAVPFDFAHAAGNVALALVAGPMMIRMLIRYRERFEWRRGALTPLLAALCLAGGLRGPRRRDAARGILVARRAAELRRRVRRLAGRGLGRRDDRLGDARARGRRAQPARRAGGRLEPGPLPASQHLRRDRAPVTWRARSSPSPGRSSTRRTSPNRDLVKALRQAAPEGRLLRRPGQPDRLRRDGAARGRTRRRE